MTMNSTVVDFKIRENLKTLSSANKQKHVKSISKLNSTIHDIYLDRC